VRATPVLQSISSSVLFVSWTTAIAGAATVTIPYVTGRPGAQPFAGHPGWVDAYTNRPGEGTSARIDEQGRFDLSRSKNGKPLTLIFMFDRIETPPFVVFNYPPDGNPDVVVPVEYACVPPGYPEVWDKKYMKRGKNFYQTMLMQCTQLYGVSVFDGPKFIWWGNKINVSVYKDNPKGEVIWVTEGGEGKSDHVSATHSDHELPRMGWRHGDMPVEPGKTYAVRAGAYTHGGDHFRLDAYIRPDRGDGYAAGQLTVDGKPTEGDLCCLIFGNGHGQLVENHIRSEEWELTIPRYRPSTCWGQSFTSHGVSLAGLSFWASSGQTADPVTCEITVYPDSPKESAIGVRKVAVSHASPLRPKIRYPDQPATMPGYDSHRKLPCELYQVAYAPDEMPLVPGKQYYVEVKSSKPLSMYVDGDYYPGGYGYYERLKADKVAGSGSYLFHSDRWTLCMNIVTYANPGGKPLATQPGK
jgi:hypothetical protein